jgi:hypothetical protein
VWHVEWSPFEKGHKLEVKALLSNLLGRGGEVVRAMQVEAGCAHTTAQWGWLQTQLLAHSCQRVVALLHSRGASW